MNSCPKCGGHFWEGPKYREFDGLLLGGWPYWSAGTPHQEALQYRCSTCGFSVFVPTVANGGTPVPPPAPITLTRRTSDVSGNQIPGDDC